MMITLDRWRSDGSADPITFSITPSNSVHGDQDSEPSSTDRFRYCAKSSKAERGAGNGHPTVKPLALMRWLVRLVTVPTGTVILDPFMGSGTTGVACALEGVEFVGMERESEYADVAERRIAAALEER